MERSLRPILRLKKVLFLAKEKPLKTMLKKWKNGPKINPNPKIKFKQKSMPFHGAINKTTQLKIKFHKKYNSKKGKKNKKEKKEQRASQKKRKKNVKAIK